MRIGLFTDTYPPYISGVATSVLMLKKGLEESGHEVFVVTVNAEGFAYKAEDNILRIPGVPIGIYDYRLTGVYPLKALSVIKGWNLDIIHTHTEFGIGTFARLIAKQYKIPLVHTYHTMYEDYIHYVTKGYFAGASKKLVEYLTVFYCDKTVKELIVPTKKAKDLFKEKYHFLRDVHIIPTGIDVSKFYKENIESKDLIKLKKDLKLTEKDFVLLFIGRLGKEKNIDFLLYNLKSVLKKIPSAKLIIAGDGPYLSDLVEIIKKEKLENSVIFTGKVPLTQVPKYFHLANVFVTASTTETQGLTVIEALASSIPVVCIDDESFQIVIKDNVNGLFFRTNEEYQEAIIKIYKEEALKNRLVKQGEITVNNFSTAVYGKKALVVYKSAIKSSQKESKSFVKKIFGQKDKK